LAQTKAAQAARAFKGGKAEEAAALYREAIKIQPQNASFHFDLAMALESTGRSQDRAEERSALEAAIDLKPGFAAAENQVGVMAVQEDDLTGAERHFRAALAASPLYADAANNLGTLLGREGHDAEAETCLRSAVSANPHFVRAWVNLAATLASESKLAEAQSAVRSALQVDPRDDNALRLSRLLSAAVKDSAPASPRGFTAKTVPAEESQ